MPKISVIVPVFNTEQHLRKCLDSIANQTFRDIEIICVDDGSTDSSPQIVEEYVRADARFRAVHKENGGLVSARKAGLALASGLYAGYVDSDDWIEPDMYEELYRTIQENQTELVTCGYYLEGNYTTVHLDTVEEGSYRGDKMKYLLDHTIYRMECRETGLRGGLWCKLFSTVRLKQAQNQIPDEISIAEDKVCLLTYLLDCPSVSVLRKPLYHWVIRGASMSHESTEQHNDYLVKIHHVYNYLMTLYKHPGFTDNMRFQAEVYIVELLFLGINKRMGFRNRNMIWIDPYWLDRVPFGARIVLYGAGELGEKYRAQLCRRPDIALAAVADDECGGDVGDNGGVISSEELCRHEYDYIVITIKNKGKAERVKRKLQRQNIPDAKIIWCEQPEAYWRYIEAERKE